MHFHRGIRGNRASRLLILSVMLLSGLLGVLSAWFQDMSEQEPQTVKSEITDPSTQADPIFVPNSFGTLAAFPVGPNGPLENPIRRKARLAEEARQATRELVDATRSNVDCAVMKCLALTYDDGPAPVLTPTLLDMLSERQAVATFFVLGSKAQEHQMLIRRAVRHGNEVGNHTWSHPNLTHADDSVIRAEIDSTNNLLRGMTNKPVRFVRPPMGEYNARAVAVAHMPMVLWSIDPWDWHNRDPELIYTHVIQHARPGSIVLLHDTYKSTITASRFIIDELQRQGYVLVTVSELFGIKPNSEANLAGQVLRHK